MLRSAPKRKKRGREEKRPRVAARQGLEDFATIKTVRGPGIELHGLLDF